MVRTADGQGYWLLGGDGGVFSYGDAAFYGSTGGTHLDAAAVAMAPTGDGHGYRFEPGIDARRSRFGNVGESLVMDENRLYKDFTDGVFDTSGHIHSTGAAGIPTS